MTNRIWILGAPDPEMVAIETLLCEYGETVLFARRADGNRVTPRDAYTDEVGRGIARQVAAHLGLTESELAERTNGPHSEVRIHCVECHPPCIEDVNHLSMQLGHVPIDHHRPGDCGYGAPPAEFLRASSLGQVIAALAIDAFEIPQDLVIAAACDHCLGAAWQGQCPGVSREDVREYRARMAATRPIEPLSRAEYLERFARTRELLESGAAARISLVELRTDGWVADAADAAAADEMDRLSVIDTRHMGHVDELPDVACFLGVAYLALTRAREIGDPHKVVLGGCTTPEMVQAFIDIWAPAHGLIGIYGDPARGFAGGYVEDVARCPECGGTGGATGCAGLSGYEGPCHHS